MASVPTVVAEKVPPAVPSLKVTVIPETGLLYWSTTLATRGNGSSVFLACFVVVWNETDTAAPEIFGEFRFPLARAEGDLTSR